MEMITLKRIVSIALVLMLVFALSVTAFAETSPEKVEYYYMTAEAVGAGKAEVNPEKVEVGSDGTVTFTATEDGGKFQKWEFHCEYDVVSGTVKDDVSYDKVVVLKPKSDIHGIAYFEGETTPGKKDDGQTAPKTGYPLYIVFGVMGLALCAGLFAAKKIKE